ncbi:MAG TPA: hypothetical protein VE959_26250 [Bryobacteraceae bacterium]|nr:hypothetical protein [Bryobacteraceae bacterium]
MSSVSSVNPALANLLQTLSNIGSPVLSSTAVVSALEKAPAGDIVQLSTAAMQLENVDAMFGISDSSSTDTSSSLMNLPNLPSGSSTDSTASATDQLANYQATLQAAETQGLLGTGSTASQPSSLFDVTG